LHVAVLPDMSSELHTLGIDMFLYQQGLDTTTPAGKAMLQRLGVFAEFEGSMVDQGTSRAGLARAKAAGTIAWPSN
jgi:DNA invertase Pin-like site-specific DNA recombinase